MTQLALDLDLPADTFLFRVVPACHLCGAQGPAIAEEPLVAPKPHLWALVEIDRHIREMHPEATGQASLDDLLEAQP